MTVIFEVEMPDGNILEIEAPKGTSPEQIKARAGAYLKQPSQPKESPVALYQRAQAGDANALAQYNARAQAAGEPSMEQDRQNNNPTQGGDNFVAGVGSSFVNTGMGLKQLGLSAGNSVGLVGDSRLAQYQGEVDRERSLQAPLMDTKAGLAGNFAGNVSQFAAGGAALAPFKAVQGAGLLARTGVGIGNGAVGGGLIASTQPVTTGQTRLGNMQDGAKFGGIAGGAGTLIGAGLGKVANSEGGRRVSGELRDLWDKAKAAGLDLYPHQVADSRAFKTVASLLAQLPLTGGQAANRNQIDQFTRMVSKAIKQDGDAVTPELQKAAKELNSRMYKEALDGVEIPRGDDLVASIRAKSLDDTLYDDKQRAMFEAIAKKMEANLKDGNMSGHIYQEMRDSFKGSNNDTSRVSRDLIENWADKNMPVQARDAWKAANRLYGNRQVVKKAMQGADSPIAKTSTEYKVNPATFRNAVNNKYPASPEIDAISRLGQLIKDPIPDSGSIGRGLAASSLGTVGGVGGLAALATAGKFTAAGITAGRVANSKGLASLLQSPKLEAVRLGTRKAIDSTAKQIEKQAPMLAAASAGARIPAYASPEQFDAQLRKQIETGEMTKPQAAAQLDAYLQMVSQKEGVDSVRETYKRFPHWAGLMNY
jgi:hypothetical protein